MEKLKIYLSKSKSGDFNQMMQIKSLLNNYDSKCEIREFNGGNYSTNLLLSSDIVIMIPRNILDIHPFHTVGRGQYDEIKLALSHNIPSYIPRIIANQLYILPISHVELHKDADWKIAFGNIFYKEEYIGFPLLLNNVSNDIIDLKLPML